MLESSDRVENFFYRSLDPSDISGRYFLMMDTIHLNLSVALSEYVTSNGGMYMECPTIGSKQHAETLRLQLIFSGSKEHFQYIRPLLCCFGTPKHVGLAAGAALTIKYAHKTVAIMNLLGFCFASALLHSLGAEPSVFIDAIKTSPFYVPTFSIWSEKISQENYQKDITWTPNQLHKELRVILNEAQAIGIDTRLLEAARDILSATVESGHGNDDLTSVFSVISATLSSASTGEEEEKKQA